MAADKRHKLSYFKFPRFILSDSEPKAVETDTGILTTTYTLPSSLSSSVTSQSTNASIKYIGLEFTPSLSGK